MSDRTRTQTDAGHSVVFEQVDAFKQLMAETVVPAAYGNDS
jgi:hypothetical protein